MLEGLFSAPERFFGVRELRWVRYKPRLHGHSDPDPDPDWLRLHGGKLDSNPDSDHLSHVDCDPDSNPDSGPGARVNGAIESWWCPASVGVTRYR